MAFRMLFHWIDLAERAGIAIGKKHRVVTEAFFAPGRPNQSSRNVALEYLAMTVRPGQGKGTDELRVAVRVIADFRIHPRHCGIEVLFRPAPARGIDAGRAVQRIDSENGIPLSKAPPVAKQ